VLGDGTGPDGAELAGPGDAGHDAVALFLRSWCPAMGCRVDAGMLSWFQVLPGSRDASLRQGRFRAAGLPGGHGGAGDPAAAARVVLPVFPGASPPRRGGTGHRGGHVLPARRVAGLATAHSFLACAGFTGNRIGPIPATSRRSASAGRLTCPLKAPGLLVAEQPGKAFSGGFSHLPLLKASD
jgi:hypothetical protein